MKKHSAPTNVPKFTKGTFIGRLVVGTTCDAIAEALKVTAPDKLRAVIRHARLPNR